MITPRFVLKLWHKTIHLSMKNKRRMKNSSDTTPKDIKTKEKEIAKKGEILKISTGEKYKTIDELFLQSHPSSVYYTLLILSVFIITCGLLLQNAPIVIGGMLVTPILTPILVISLAISVAEINALKSPLSLLVKSTIAVIGVSTLITIFFGSGQIEHILQNDIRTAILYFIVAAASGMAATFAWVRKEVSDILPGVSIAVSLVPPLSLIGINLGTLQFETARFYFTVYCLNLFGIIAGSMIIFSLLKFQKNRMAVVKIVKEYEEIEKNKQAKIKAKKTIEKINQLKKSIEETIELDKQKKKTDF